MIKQEVPTADGPAPVEDARAINPIRELVGTDECSIPQLVEARVARSPDATFLTWDERAWSYREAWDECLRFAGWARAEQNAAADYRGRIASYLANSPEAVWCWLGALAVGLTYVPLNREHRGSLLSDMLERSGAGVLVTDREGIESLSEADLEHFRRIVLVDDAPIGQSTGSVREVHWSEIARHEPVDPVRSDPLEVAEVMFTSGTTGRSKAALLSHNQLCRGAGWVAWSLGLEQSDVFHAWLPLFHIAGQADSVLPMVVSGGSVALQPTFSRSRFWKQVEGTSASIFIGFSNVAELLCSLPESHADRSNTLRAGVVGAVSAELRSRFESRFGVVLHDVYGMTEAEPMAIAPPNRPTPMGSCGLPSPDFQLSIMSPADEPLEQGDVGEIRVRPRRDGVLSAGYEADPEATLAANAGGWFRTGDLGRLDEDGFVYFVDRLKHVIRRRGENISSWELENLVLEHPLVGECCAVGISSALGEDDVKIAVGVPGGMARLSPPALWAWCEERMARFMVPTYIEVVDRLPRAPTGKVLKEELRDVSGDVWKAE